MRLVAGQAPAAVCFMRPVALQPCSVCFLSGKLALPRLRRRRGLTAALHVNFLTAIARREQVSGQMYYHLSRARQGRRIRDVVLVRLEQIAPFPHDLVGKASIVPPCALGACCQALVSRSMSTSVPG